MNATVVEAPVKLKNILFATDFSEASGNAIPLVKKLADHYHSSIVAFHVRPPVVNPMTPVAGWQAEAEAAKIVDGEHRDQLRKMFAGMPSRVIIEEGPLANCFEAAIKENAIDLLVMGTRGRTGIGKLLLGSVAEEILRVVDVPVLTVGPNVDTASMPTRKFKQVLFATDLNSASERGAAYAYSLAHEFGARLTLLHVVPEEVYADRPDALGEARERLRKLVPCESDMAVRPSYFSEHGEPAKKILEIADLLQPDVIVLGARPEKGVVGAATHLPIATVHRIVAHAKCPVLTIRN
jgi:nucleotide-binding universal stress UspA family protein